MRRAFVIGGGIAAAALVWLAVTFQPLLASRIGAGITARTACGLVFNSGLDLERVTSGYLAPLVGPAWPLIDARVVPEERAAISRAAWVSRARAIHRDGAGCVLVLDADEAALRAWTDPPQAPPLSAELPWPEGGLPPVAPPPPALTAAIEAAFSEPEGEAGPLRQTLAVLVAHRGRLVAERYAPGVDAATPLLSWSAAKSVIAALVGVAVLEGRLDLHGPAPVPEWSAPGDPRGEITLDQLLRMSSGLAFDEHYGAVNDVSRMLFAETDAGAYAAGMPLAFAPDTHWAYSSGTSNILARVVRDLFAGDAEAMVRWSREAFFDPAGMRRVVFELDASGSFVGSSLLYATGRDWARFGQLHLDDGEAAGRRLLPEGFSRYVSTPTPAAPEGRYGAGWWLNAGDPAQPERRAWPTVPRDAYAAQGMSGQYVVVIPSAELVVVRFGLTQPGDEALDGIEPLLRAAVEFAAVQ